MITRGRTVFPGIIWLQRLRIELSFNGRPRRADNRLGNTVFLSDWGALSSASVSAATRIQTREPL